MSDCVVILSAGLAAVRSQAQENCLLLAVLVIVEQRAAALPRTAAASVATQQAFGDLAIDRELVIVREFLAAWDRALGLDVYAAMVVFEGLAVGVARVIDPACRVATNPRIDHASVFQLEQEGVKRVPRIAVRATIGLLLRNPLAAVLDDARALAYRSSREHAAAVDGRVAYAIERLLVIRR